MTGILKIAVAAAVLSLLSACSSPRYLISTTNGTLIQTKGEPQLNKKTDMYEYRDMDGNKGSIKHGDVTQIVER